MRLYDNQPAGTVDRARTLRRTATNAETRLLHAVKGAFPDLKWRRQVPIGPYYADILCFAAKLVIEVDGGQHDEAAAYDARRTRFIENEGYTVLRFWNTDVLANADGVIESIRNSLSHREWSVGSAMPPAWPERCGASFTQHWPREALRSGKGEGDRQQTKEKGEPAFANSPSPDLATLGHPLPKGEGF
ncbi:endonuclease domain-containing protein [Sphingomonas sp. Leaf357]|uniref:endonuclease domain-containing protein n=1 Tax=Sphingomonas sp. Leaf357 TaxID=1736350 RepID=UPI0009E7CDD9|nr:DUF559 domain-containing protein [Sphingomonas sp. Leaf357]